MINNKIRLISKFGPEDSDIVTEQTLICICGDFMSMTEPSPLDIPLAPASIVGNIHKNQIN